ncbi:MAG: alpha/beta hydrolase [Clostridia bacterium]|nr:alpha/beta hydrolase [Clostridia bacterium]
MEEKNNIDSGKAEEIKARFREIIVPEDNYAAVMDNTVLPFLQKRRTDRQLTVEPGKSLHIVRYTSDPDNAGSASEGTVFIVHGFTETTEKYRELAYYLLNFGYDVVIFDQRGHGFSYREVEDMQLTHIDKFSTYVSDLEAVIASELPQSKMPCDLYAHSMGGAVAGLYLEKNFDQPFKKAVLSSPMIAPERGGFPLWVSKAMAGTFIAFGQKKKRLFLSKAPEGRESFEEAASNSAARFEYYQDVKLSAPEYSNNGPSYAWTMESLKVTAKLLKKGEPEKIRIPVLLFVADGDTTVVKDDIIKMADRIPSGELERVSNCRHEIYYGPNGVLEEYIPRLIAFLAG